MCEARELPHDTTMTERNMNLDEVLKEDRKQQRRGMYALSKWLMDVKGRLSAVKNPAKRGRPRRCKLPRAIVNYLGEVRGVQLEQEVELHEGGVIVGFMVRQPCALGRGMVLLGEPVRVGPVVLHGAMPVLV